VKWHKGTRVALLALAAYVGVGLVTGVLLITTGPRSDFHWLGTLMAAVLWWPVLLFGTIIYFLSHR